jgi:hypothetical protein
MNGKDGRLLIVLVFSVVFFLSGISLHPESGIYDRLGIWPESGYHGAFPEEHPDLFTGGLCLKFLDIWLPGPNASGPASRKHLGDSGRTLQLLRDGF